MAPAAVGEKLWYKLAAVDEVNRFKAGLKVVG